MSFECAKCKDMWSEGYQETVGVFNRFYICCPDCAVKIEMFIQNTNLIKELQKACSEMKNE